MWDKQIYVTIKSNSDDSAPTGCIRINKSIEVIEYVFLKMYIIFCRILIINNAKKKYLYRNVINFCIIIDLFYS